MINPEEGDFITNQKLQKLLYYAQGFHLAIHNKALFSEPIEAWRSGPVVPVVYDHYKKCNGGSILPLPTELDISKYARQTQELLDEVFEVYGRYTTPMLMRFTYQEAPWKITKLNEVIPDGLIKEFFKTQLIRDANTSNAPSL